MTVRLSWFVRSRARRASSSKGAGLCWNTECDTINNFSVVAAPYIEVLRKQKRRIRKKYESISVSIWRTGEEKNRSYFKSFMKALRSRGIAQGSHYQSPSMKKYHV